MSDKMDENMTDDKVRKERKLTDAERKAGKLGFNVDNPLVRAFANKLGGKSKVEAATETEQQLEKENEELKIRLKTKKIREENERLKKELGEEI